MVCHQPRVITFINIETGLAPKQLQIEPEDTMPEALMSWLRFDTSWVLPELSPVPAKVVNANTDVTPPVSMWAWPGTDEPAPGGPWYVGKMKSTWPATDGSMHAHRPSRCALGPATRRVHDTKKGAPEQ